MSTKMNSNDDWLGKVTYVDDRGHSNYGSPPKTDSTSGKITAEKAIRYISRLQVGVLILVLIASIFALLLEFGIWTVNALSGLITVVILTFGIELEIVFFVVKIFVKIYSHFRKTRQEKNERKRT